MRQIADAGMLSRREPHEETTYVDGHPSIKVTAKPLEHRTYVRGALVKSKHSDNRK